MCVCVCVFPCVYVCVCATRAMLHLCTRPVQPSTPLSLTQASGRPELSINLASYREQWSCGVCLGQRVHINLSSKRPTRTAMLVVVLFSFSPKTRFLGGKKLAVCYVLLSAKIWINFRLQWEEGKNKAKYRSIDARKYNIDWESVSSDNQY